MGRVGVERGGGMLGWKKVKRKGVVLLRLGRAWK